MNRVRRGPESGTSLEAALLVVGVAALGFNLRGAIAGLPPVFPELQARLHLSSAGISVLAATPVICFGVVSAFAAPVARRLGEEWTLFLATLALTAGLLLRAVAPGALLFPGTILACAGIAVMNVLLGSLIKRRWPERAGFLVGLYITTLSLGAIVASVTSVPIYDATGNSLPVTLGWLVIPAALGAALWLPQLRARGTAPRPGPRMDAPAPRMDAPAPRLDDPGPRLDDPGPRLDDPAPRLDDPGPRLDEPGPGPDDPGPSSDAAPSDPGARAPAGHPGTWWIWRHAVAWQVALFMGMQSLLYYATISWLPTILRDRGVSADGAGFLLGVLGVGNLALALVTPVLAQRMRSQHALVVPIVIGIAVGTAGAVWAPIGSAVVWMLILGAAQNAALGVAIYFMVARAPDPAVAASLSAMSQSAGYLLASLGPLEVGLLHSATGGWNVPVTVLLVLTVALLAAGLLAARPRTLPSAPGAGHVTPDDKRQSERKVAGH